MTPKKLMAIFALVAASAAFSSAANAGPWMRLGTQTFGWRADTSVQPSFFAGRQIDRIRLRPLDDDAACARVLVQFGDGRNQLARPAHILQGNSFVMELRGYNARDIRWVRLTCRALRARDVTIAIESQRDDDWDRRYGHRPWHH